MKKIVVNEDRIKLAATVGTDEFINVFTDSIYDSLGGELTADNMNEINSNQITLLAYRILRDEIMNGGFIQLIHNGYGAFIYHNPLAKIMKNWGLNDLHKIINKTHRLYNTYHEEIEKDCSDDDFMALYEQYPQFDDYDDYFVIHEEEWTNAIAHYVDEHINDFVKIAK